MDDLGNLLLCVKRSMPKTIIINKGTYMNTNQNMKLTIKNHTMKINPPNIKS
jgi:hypothetical protein